MVKKITQTKIKETQTNEGLIISEIENTSFIVDREPDYVKVYIQDIGRINEVTKEENNVLLEFIRHMGYSNVIPVFKPIKEMIAKKLGISFHTVDKAVKKFKKKGLFIPYQRGMYIADPSLFGKGKWQDIKNLRLVIEYDEKGEKRLKSNISESLQLKLDI